MNVAQYKPTSVKVRGCPKNTFLHYEPKLNSFLCNTMCLEIRNL